MSLSETCRTRGTGGIYTDQLEERPAMGPGWSLIPLKSTLLPRCSTLFTAHALPCLAMPLPALARRNLPSDADASHSSLLPMRWELFTALTLPRLTSPRPSERYLAPPSRDADRIRMHPRRRCNLLLTARTKPRLSTSHQALPRRTGASLVYPCNCLRVMPRSATIFAPASKFS